MICVILQYYIIYDTIIILTSKFLLPIGNKNISITRAWYMTYDARHVRRQNVIFYSFIMSPFLHRYINTYYIYIDRCT